VPLNFDLNTIWFVLVGVLFTGYAILDGFDFGVGMLHLTHREDQERRISLNSIGPVWDGNEVWLVTGGGALFAAFPHVYATVFSGFYIAFMLLLCALIFRAVAIEFRSKQEQKWWRSFWDWAFSISSFVCSLLIGVALGNMVTGVPIRDDMEYAGGFFTLLNPYSLLLGLTVVSLFAMHGSIFLAMKTEGEMQKRVRGYINPLIITFIILNTILTLATLLYEPQVTDAIRKNPVFFVVVILALLAVANIPREIHRGKDFYAFLSSCATMVFLMMLFGLGTYPNMVFSDPNPENSLTIYNAASSAKTLQIMLIMAIIGLPFVLAYTAGIYWIFRGKVRITDMSY
jgi:cytochrome d ubiquinol oxidase subunit II